MVTIGVNQLIINSAMYEHIYLENIQKLCKYSGKRDEQEQYKRVIESEMFSTSEEFTDNSPMSHRQYETVKNPSARKPIHQFLEALDAKPNTSVCIFCSSKSQNKAIIYRGMMLSCIPRRQGHPQINEQVKNILKFVLYNIFMLCRTQ